MDNIIDILQKNKILLPSKKIAPGKKSGTAALKQNTELMDLVLNATNFLTSDYSLISRLYCITNNITKRPICPTCNIPILKFNSTLGFQKFCSAKCAQTNPETKQTISQNNKEKYGCHPRQTEEVKSKQKQTNLKKYGVEQPLMSEDIQHKSKLTNLKKYGTEYYQQSDIGKMQIKQNNIEKYGVEYPFKDNEFQQKIQKHIIEKYGVTSTMQLDWVKEKHLQSIKSKYQTNDVYNNLNDPDWLFDQHHTQSKTLTEIALLLGLKDEKSVSKKLIQFDIPILIHNQKRSIGETQLCDFLIENNIKIETNNRDIIHPKELDIYIPEHQFAIEYCGLYWHSDIHKTNNYHKHKLDLCNQQGIRLITIFEDEWNNNQELVKSKILTILGKNNQSTIFARKCKIVHVSSKNKTKFFDRYHIQGSGPGSISIGLEHNNKLVACMSFIKQKDNIYVLNRYATSNSIPGGFSKLLSHFKKNNEWNQVVSFADLRWSEGSVYDNNGFVLDKKILPDYSYIMNGQRFHKFGFRRKFLEKKLPKFDPNLSERQNCDNAGLLRIWDCGKLRYIINNS